MTDEAPPIQHYEILAYATITKKSGWWNLVALLADPKSNNAFIALYKYKKQKGEWKRVSTFKLNVPAHVHTAIQGLEELYELWAERES